MDTQTQEASARPRILERTFHIRPLDGPLVVKIAIPNRIWPAVVTYAPPAGSQSDDEEAAR